MQKRLVASGRVTARGHILIDHTLTKDSEMMTQCPSCGDLQDEVSTDTETSQTTYHYECGSCHASWSESWRDVPPTASIVGGDSDGNIYTANLEALS
jgi:hypothetical protein